MASPWTSTSYVALAASGVRWRIEQAEAFREQVEQFSDAERVILADAYQALLRYGPVPDPSSPLVVHRFRDPRAGDAYALKLLGGCCGTDHRHISAIRRAWPA